MKKAFTCIAALLVLAGGLNGCKKDHETTVATGSISGKCNPIGFVSSIVAVKVGSTDTIHATLDTSSYSFSISGLQAGDYKIIFTAIPGIIAPDTALVTVVAGENYNMGTLAFPIKPVFGSISGTITPAGAVSSITATERYGNGIAYTAVPDAATGVFKIAGIEYSDDYVISFTSAATYALHQNVVTTVSVPGNTDMGTISFEEGGYITGTLSLAEGLSDLYLVNMGNNDNFPVAFDPVSGNFKSAGLPAGNYSVMITPAYGYKSTGNFAVSVATGETKDVGTIVIQHNMLDGLPFSVRTADQSYSAPNLSIYSTYQDQDQVGGRQSFTITMDNISGPGTYTCQGTATSNMTYTISATGGPFGLPDRLWSTNNAGGKGTILVTSIDPAKREIKGTFTATLVSTTGDANVVINNGSFYFGY